MKWGSYKNMLLSQGVSRLTWRCRICWYDNLLVSFGYDRLEKLPWKWNMFLMKNKTVTRTFDPILTLTHIIERTNECFTHSTCEDQMKYIFNNSSAFCFKNTLKIHLQPFPELKKPFFMHGCRRHCTKKHVCTAIYFR